MDLLNHKEFLHYTQLEPINLGWSGDAKYKALYRNQEVIIRISDINKYDLRKEQYNYLKIINNTYQLNIPKPIDFGTLDNKYVYTVLTYLKGEDAIDKIKEYDDKKQYQLGLEAGNILKKINSIKIPRQKQTWHQSYIKKIDKKIAKSLEYKEMIPEYNKIIQHIEENKHLVKNRRNKLCHTDFHLGNMVIHEDHLYVIDFDKLGIEDAYCEFKPYIWNVYRSIPFQNGLLNGYFNHDIPKRFFEVLSLYAAESIISHIPWAHKFDDKEVRTALEVAHSTLSHFDNFNQIIPTWYEDKTYE